MTGHRWRLPRLAPELPTFRYLVESGMRPGSPVAQLPTHAEILAGGRSGQSSTPRARARQQTSPTAAENILRLAD
jgi:hypothetical protein